MKRSRVLASLVVSILCLNLISVSSLATEQDAVIKASWDVSLSVDGVYGPVYVTDNIGNIVTVLSETESPNIDWEIKVPEGIYKFYDSKSLCLLQDLNGISSFNVTGGMNYEIQNIVISPMKTLWYYDGLNVIMVEDYLDGEVTSNSFKSEAPTGFEEEWCSDSKLLDIFTFGDVLDSNQIIYLKPRVYYQSSKPLIIPNTSLNGVLLIGDGTEYKSTLYVNGPGKVVLYNVNTTGSVTMAIGSGIEAAEGTVNRVGSIRGIGEFKISGTGTLIVEEGINFNTSKASNHLDIKDITLSAESIGGKDGNNKAGYDVGDISITNSNVTTTNGTIGAGAGYFVDRADPAKDISYRGGNVGNITILDSNININYSGTSEKFAIGAGSSIDQDEQMQGSSGDIVVSGGSLSINDVPKCLGAYGLSKCPSVSVTNCDVSINNVYTLVSADKVKLDTSNTIIGTLDAESSLRKSTRKADIVLHKLNNSFMQTIPTGDYYFISDIETVDNVKYETVLFDSTDNYLFNVAEDYLTDVGDLTRYEVSESVVSPSTAFTVPTSKITEESLDGRDVLFSVYALGESALAKPNEVIDKGPGVYSATLVLDHDKFAYTIKEYKQNSSDDGYTLYEKVHYGDLGEVRYTIPKGWSLSTSETSNLVGTVTEDGSLVLSVYIDRPVYSITFDPNDETPVESINVRDGAEIIPPVFEKEGSTLEGWYVDKNLLVKFDLSKATDLNNGTTIYAKWDIKEYPTDPPIEPTPEPTPEPVPPINGGGSSSSGSNVSYSAVEITGVVKGVTGEVVENATVTLTSKNKVYTVLTDFEGKYLFNCPTGRYFIKATYAGVVSNEIELNTTVRKYVADDLVFKKVVGIRNNLYTNGSNTKGYNPESVLTRDEAVEVIYRMNKGQSIEQYTVLFKDVPLNAWYLESLKYCVSNKIVFGKSETMFDPTSNITREEFAVLIARAMRLSDVFTSNHFDDIDSEWSANYINKLAELGIVNGTSDRKFNPKSDITRIEMIAIINRVIGHLISEDEVSYFKHIGVLKDVGLSEDHWGYYDVITATHNHYIKA